MSEPYRLDNFEEVYTAHFNWVYRYLCRRAETMEDAQDMVSETFLRAFRGWNGFRNSSTASTWVFRIANRVLADHYRSRKRRPSAVIGDGTAEGRRAAARPAEVYSETEAVFLRKERLAELRTVVSRLTERQQDILALRFAGGLKNTEIAAMLGMSEGAVKMALHRMVLKLREEYRA